jgi:dihydroorotate dehydrogenase electron transfer subunit
MFDEVVQVIENRPLTGGHFLLSLHAARQAAATRAGQFAMVRLLGRADVLLRRPMSIYDVKPVEHRSGPCTSSRLVNRRQRAAAKPARSPAVLQLLYKCVGRGTRLMANLKNGDAVGLLAPLGHGFFQEEYLDQAKRSDEVLHVAGGIGIAALLMPAQDLATQGIRQQLFFGGRTRQDLVALDDFKPLVRRAFLATENGSYGYRGYVTQPLAQYLEKHRARRFLITACGPWAMLGATVKLARRYGHRCLVSMENRMGCALGVCLGCCIRVDATGHSSYQRVCTEGPVFWAEKVIWEKEAVLKT